MSDFGRYRIQRVLGRGGMAEVFEAVAGGDASFERLVALKRVLPDMAEEPGVREMFLDEARLASQLHHGNIVSVLDFGLADGCPYQVLEYIDGLDLGELLSRGARSGLALPEALAIHICTEVAHALSYAHQARDRSGEVMHIVHRDLSPGNVLLSWSGDVKLTDFGIAYARERTAKTLVGTVKGTLLYMAPEQLVRGTIDGRTDLFGLGCLLHTLLTGESPMAADQAMADLLAGAELELDVDLPEDLREILARALASHKDRRYTDAAAMAEALGRASARRLQGDAKSELRAYLAKLGPKQLTPRTPALGGLFELEWAPPTPNGIKQLRTASSPTVSTPQIATEEIEPPARRFRVLPWILFLALSGGGGVGAWLILRTSLARPGARVAIDGGTVTQAQTQLDAAAPQRATTADAGALQDAGRVAPDARVVRPTRDDRDKEVGRGYMLIGGPGAHRAEIFVNRRSFGFAPKRIELATGRHKIELRGPDGKTVRKTWVVKKQHTQSSPLRWIVQR